MDKNLKALELERVLEMLAREATCDDAKELALKLKPVNDIDEAQLLLSQTEDAYSLLARFGAPSFSGLKNVNNALSRAAAGGELNTSELLEKYKKPDSFDDLIYLTGLTQAECVGNAAEHWRRNSGRCNGALWWQLNDCWGAPSWSSVDYSGKWKPLMYEAKRFFAPLAVSIKENKGSAEVYVINDTLEAKKCRVEFKIMSFDGKLLFEKSAHISSPSVSALSVLKASLRGFNKKHCFAIARLYCEGEPVSQKTIMLTPERKARLKAADITVSLSGNELTLKSNTYARKVFVDIKGSSAPLSDNCFDLLPGEEKKILLGDSSIDKEQITVKCVNNVKSSASEFSRIAFRLGFSIKPENIANRVYYSVS